MEFLEYIGRVSTFDYLWFQLPPYPGFTRPNKAYQSVRQWQCKKMRNILRVLLGVFTTSLGQTFNIEPLASRYKHLAYTAILCVRFIIDFIVLAQYKVDTSRSIQSMRDYLEDFHKYKDVFLRFQATKATKSVLIEAARQLGLELKLLR